MLLLLLSVPVPPCRVSSGAAAGLAAAGSGCGKHQVHPEGCGPAHSTAAAAAATIDGEHHVVGGPMIGTALAAAGSAGEGNQACNEDKPAHQQQQQQHRV